MIDDYNQFAMIANNDSEFGELFGGSQDSIFGEEKKDSILTLKSSQNSPYY